MEFLAPGRLAQKVAEVREGSEALLRLGMGRFESHWHTFPRTRTGVGAFAEGPPSSSAARIASRSFGS